MELPSNPSDDVKRLNPEIYSKVLDMIDVAVPSKYHAVRTGHYHSRKEARFADTLELRRKAGEIAFWLEQVPFRLPGDVVYRLDFVVFKVNLDLANRPCWTVEFVEVKGKDLPMGKLKRKQVEDLYGIKITVV
jgi:hypothetical protein